MIEFIFFLLRLLLGPSTHPPLQNLRASSDDNLYFDSLTRGALVSGNPGTGKTVWTAMQLFNYVRQYPDRPLFIFDFSGSLINEFIELVYSLPPYEMATMLNRLVLDIPGHNVWVVPKPFFSPAYGLSLDELVEKATNIFEQLNPELMAQNPMMRRSITTTAPNIFRLLSAIQDENGDSWQITEAKKLLIDPYEGGLLETAVKRFGGKVPQAKWYLEKELLRKNITPTGMEARTTAIISELNVLEPHPLRARYGYACPTITEQEIIDQGKIYLLSGERLTNQPKAAALVFWEALSSLRAIINRRTPHDSNDKPILLAIDEVYRLFEIEGMAKAIGEISTYYRSRQFMLMIIIQAYWQLSPTLQESIWNLGTHAAFASDNFNDTYKFGQQMIKYNPKQEKLPPKTSGFQPVIEPDRGQYLMFANWLQSLNARQVVLRRYRNEQEKETFIHFIERTQDKPAVRLPAPLAEIKESLLERHSIPISEALNQVNQRSLHLVNTSRPTAA